MEKIEKYYIYIIENNKVHRLSRLFLFYVSVETIIDYIKALESLDALNYESRIYLVVNLK